MVGKRLVAMASHFDEIAAQAESPGMTPIEVKGNDEISVVGIAFNNLLEQLRATQGSLEQRVQERTTELSATNAALLAEIRERKEAEEALRKSEQKFRLVTETIQDVFWISDPALNEIIYVSPAYEQIWQRTCQSLYEFPRSFADSIHSDDREQALGHDA